MYSLTKPYFALRTSTRLIVEPDNTIQFDSDVSGVGGSYLLNSMVLKIQDPRQSLIYLLGIVVASDLSLNIP